MTWEDAIARSPLGLACREGEERLLGDYLRNKPVLERELNKILENRAVFRFLRSTKMVYQRNTNNTTWTKCDPCMVEGFQDWHPVHSPNELS